MSRKGRAGKQTQRITPVRIAWLAGIVLSIALPAAIWFVRQPSAESGTGALGPRLAVNQERIDLGTQPFNRTVRAEFILTNQGDRTLQLDATTPVRVLEGC
jgi:hypothetical protein